jgi:hypothetical protein
VPESWQLDIEYEAPRMIELNLPGFSGTQRFWYMIYTVSNPTDEDRIFIPEFVLYTESGELHRAGQHVPRSAFERIKQLYNNPLLKNQTAMTGKLLQGEDNAKTGIAIWRDFDPKAGAFDIFIGGLSGETEVVELPVPIRMTEVDIRGNVQEVTRDEIVLARTLRLRYNVPGEAAGRGRVVPRLTRREWVMR